MRIVIIYTLQTDGDYRLDNPEEFGCIKEDDYNYSGSVEFAHDKKDRCLMEARDFLYKFLCDGIHISYTHAWLLKYFYNLIESLVNKIYDYEPNGSGKYICEESISGNYEGTDFEVLIIE